MPTPSEPPRIRTARPGEYAPLLQRLYDQHAKNGQTVGEPASPAELARAEELIGFPLPPLLKALYLEANGGWAYNFYPLFDPAPLPLLEPEPLSGETGEGVIDRYLVYRSRDLEEDLELVENDRPRGPDERWPPYFLPLTGDGRQGEFAVVCNRSGLPVRHVYGEGGVHNGRVADSLEEWLERWLDREARRTA